MPELAGSEIHDDPLAPISTWGERRVAEAGDDAAIDWLPREARYNEKLATPDVSIADLIGDIDPIKAATRRLTYADPEVIHFGIVPRTNRGIFAINELPDLPPRIQVGLLNLLEERDLQIRGFPVRLPLDILFVFSANPEDYTNRGSIITPLKDRIASQILTHYPPTAELASRDHRAGGVDRARPAAGGGPASRCACWSRRSRSPRARASSSTRAPASRRASRSRALELLVSNLERRALRDRRRRRCCPRVCDLPLLGPAITGKIEMVYEGEQQGAEMVARKLVGQAVAKRLPRALPRDRSRSRAARPRRRPYAPILAWFASGHAVTLSDETPFAEHEAELARVPGLAELVAGPRRDAARSAPSGRSSCSRDCTRPLQLARQDLDSAVSYKEMLKFQLLKPARRGRGRGDVN